MTALRGARQLWENNAPRRQVLPVRSGVDVRPDQDAKRNHTRQRWDERED
jgi:hypothetical protein